MNKTAVVIYQYGRPYGIRDEAGFLFFFSKVDHYQGQDQRYAEECAEQDRLADFLVAALNSRIPKEPTP